MSAALHPLTLLAPLVFMALGNLTMERQRQVKGGLVVGLLGAAQAVCIFYGLLMPTIVLGAAAAGLYAALTLAYLRHQATQKRS